MAIELQKITEKWDLTYNHAVGETASRYFYEIKENKQIFGKYCPSCKKVIVPPRSFCDSCFTDTTEWVKVANEGVIECATIICSPFKTLPDPPYALSYVKLDGADTAMGGYVKGIDLTNIDNAMNILKIGNRIKVIFKDDRQGNVLDYWFEPV
ncbi:MAG: zinc ribbon domain-containing protein [Pseudomonadota bacterium]